VTDTDGEIRFDREAKPGVSNLLGIYSAVTGESIRSLEDRFAGAGYGALKGELADVVVAHLDPIRGRAEDLLSDPGELDRLLAVGAERASDQAEKTLKAVYEAIGFMAPRA
jgi:tryptophanyl-tRNA synthetase